MRLDQIDDLLDKINGCTFAGLDCLTDIRLSGGKANPYRGKIIKWSKGNRVMLFTNKRSVGYENMVRRRLEQEGKDPNSFDLGELAWGLRVPNSPLIDHDGKYYLQVIFLKPGTVEYFATDDIYWYLDSGEKFIAYKAGDQVAEHNIRGLEPPKGSGRQGLTDDNKVVVRSYNLESIKCIRLFKEQRSEEICYFQACDDDEFEEIGQINIGGVDIGIIEDEDAEKCSLVVCVRKEGYDSPFTDNIEDRCANCGEEIVYRPSVPKTPPKICVQCVSAMVEKENGRVQ